MDMKTQVLWVSETLSIIFSLSPKRGRIMEGSIAFGLQ